MCGKRFVVINRIKDGRSSRPSHRKYCSLECRKTAQRKAAVKKSRNRPIRMPHKEELAKLVWEKPTSQLAKEFGVSDKAVEKWCKNYGIEKPGRGYWQKKKPKE